MRNNRLQQVTGYRFQRSRKGFTLVELLVVISIIVILITMGVTSFSTVQKKARDSKRKTDLRDIKNAFEQYYSSCGMAYPTSIPGGSNFDPITCGNPSLTMLDPIPKDPKTGVEYSCLDEYFCDGSRFRFCTTLETDTSDYCVENSQ